MILSLFIRDKEFHLSCGNFEQIYTIKETRGMADKVPEDFKTFIGQLNFREIDTVLYSSGPASFTTARIMNSMLKGIKVVHPDMKFVGISHFVTYLSIIIKHHEQGAIAIPTMRGDYFICRFANSQLGTMYVDSEISNDTIISNNPVLENINLAMQQYTINNSEVFIKNIIFITNDLEIDYGITPEYSH